MTATTQSLSPCGAYNLVEERPNMKIIPNIHSGSPGTVEFTILLDPSKEPLMSTELLPQVYKNGSSVVFLHISIFSRFLVSSLQKQKQKQNKKNKHLGLE